MSALDSWLRNVQASGAAESTVIAATPFRFICSISPFSLFSELALDFLGYMIYTLFMGYKK